MHASVISSSPVLPLSAQELFPNLYRELRRLARSRLASGGRNTLLDTSALVNETYLRMQRETDARFNDREHFMAYAATTMRHVVIDFIRRRRAERRGGGAEHLTLDTRDSAVLDHGADEAEAVHEALQTLAQIDAGLVQVVEMRYFGGFTDLEIAQAMGVTDRTVRRHWERARLLLSELLAL
ncbi:ECF-type sigma factor [Aquabacterium sp. OR-4]|uniref:ECF-type sigma factor n=1 Tax=Aquabacterium sp. OR-4 TaxID=2978127 RepID=UPI0028C7D75B|nr:ECF-type sigma factor [Aquabacterium sp. OR-4]MDT7837997.1 ECF-type sigma factor [Aquabacterium sp. OR-4]